MLLESGLVFVRSCRLTGKDGRSDLLMLRSSEGIGARILTCRSATSAAFPYPGGMQKVERVYFEKYVPVRT